MKFNNSVLSLTATLLYVSSQISTGISHAAPPAPPVRVVATTQQPGFQSIDGLGITLNDDGYTAFRSAGGRIWSEADGLRQIVADQNTLAPGTSAFFGSSFAPPIINRHGDVAFYGVTEGGDTTAFNNRGIWVGKRNDLQLLVRTGMPAPGHAAGVVFSSFRDMPASAPDAGLRAIVINSRGTTAFAAHVTGPGIEVNRTEGIWAGEPGNLQLIAMENRPAPNGLGTFIGMGVPTINDHGRIAFKSTVLPPIGDAYSGIFTHLDGITSVVAKGIDPAPGGGAGVTFKSIPTEPVINNAGDVAFGASTSRRMFDTDSRGVWAFRDEVLQKVAVTGDPAPGTPDRFHTIFGAPVINAQGRTAFTASLISPTNTISTSLWSEGRTGALELIAKEGMPAPGLPVGFGFGNNFRSFSLNSSGRIAFISHVSNTNNVYGIWAQDINFDLQLIALAGNQVPGSGINSNITIGELSFIGGSGNQDGRRSGFNDFGQVAFRAGFQSGSLSAGFVSSLAAVPEPSAVTMVVVPLFLSLTRRRARATSLDLVLEQPS